MTHFSNGFTDELVKVARLKGAHKFVKRLRKSKDLRDAIRRSAVLGGATGAATGLVSKDSDQSALRRVLGGGALGALGGGITGAAFPGWFSRANMRAADESIVRRKLSRLAQHLK